VTLAPRWLTDLERLLPIRSQFVLSGNIRDLALVEVAGKPVLVPLVRALWERLAAQGYAFLVVHDLVDGIRVYPQNDALRQQATEWLQLPKANADAAPMGVEALGQLAGRVASLREARCALLVDFASRLARSPASLDAAEHRFFVTMEKLATTAAPIVPQPTKPAGAASATASATPSATASPSPSTPAPAGPPRFNPVIWLANRNQDLPSWLTLDTERIETIVVPEPDYEARRAAAALLGPLFVGHEALAADAQTQFAKSFADATDRLTLSALADIAQMAAGAGLGPNRIDDAVRSYKVGAVENPWKQSYLRERIAGATEAIERRVKGQRRAVVKTVDILMRSVMGLTGAHARAGGHRPRGVLFFAGPTGVGKTELAKTLTEIVFGDERAYIRFDMSEFAAEHSAARLLGAPPGYVGFDAGGELTNAVRARPFSVILFDEIEKAHPRILDKFLQILEDGRLTDGRGQTAYFSESILVFTSNLGITVEDETGRRVQNVQPGDDPVEVETRVRAAIADHFKFRLMRPEILNRIGDNVVVFDFIAPAVAERIFDGMLANVLARAREEHAITIVLSDAIRERLREACTSDLSNGGRGIGNRLESVFVNPLARALFALPADGPRTVDVADLAEVDRVWTVTLR
jgi:energy-coupling factor transporter ATP-binding protein EcfA2